MYMSGEWRPTELRLAEINRMRTVCDFSMEQSKNAGFSSSLFLPFTWKKTCKHR